MQNTHKKLFIVDDDAAFIRIYDRILRPPLETSGIEVRTFFDPTEVLAAVEKGDVPELLLTDDRMPFMLGRQLASELRARGFAGKILMVSGTADEDVLSQGVDSLLPKPFGTAELRDTVRSLLG